MNGGSDEDDLFDDEVDGMTLPRPGRSNLHGRKDYESSCWGRMLTLDKLKLLDPNSEEFRILRLRSVCNVRVTAIMGYRLASE